MAFRKSPVKLDSEGLWTYALRLLGQRPYSAGELRQRLSRRAAEPATVVSTLAKLQEYGMADDGRFSEAFAFSRLQNNGFGKQRVLRDLRTKRVPEKIAEEAIAKVFAGTEETALIEQYLARKYRGKDLGEFLADDKNLQSAYRRLRTAGFSSAACFSVLRRFKDDLPAADDEDDSPVY
jgi:regulatory protein